MVIFDHGSESRRVEHGCLWRVPVSGFYKLRVGDYRIIYAVKDDIVFVLVVAQRGTVYELAGRRK